MLLKTFYRQPIDHHLKPINAALEFGISFLDLPESVSDIRVEPLLKDLAFEIDFLEIQDEGANQKKPLLKSFGDLLRRQGQKLQEHRRMRRQQYSL